MTAVSRCANPCGAMHVNAHVVIACNNRLTGMQAHPYADLKKPSGQCMSGERVLRFDSSVDRFRGARKHGE